MGRLFSNVPQMVDFAPKTMCPIQCKVTPGSEAWRKNILVYTTMHVKMNESRCIPGKLISQILKMFEKIFFIDF